MESIGETLRRLREERELTLEQLHVRTKIAARYLEAIEEDRFGALPGKTYITAFIRAYASAVGLPKEEALRLYHREKIETGPEEEVLWSDQPDEPRKADSRARWIALVAAAVILLVVLAFVFFPRS